MAAARAGYENFRSAAKALKELESRREERDRLREQAAKVDRELVTIRVRAEQTGLRPRKQITANTPLIGGLPRAPGGMPTFRPSGSDVSEFQPSAARFQAPIFPDNPLVLEGLKALYLNSEKATELRDPQVEALLAWLNAGIDRALGCNGMGGLLLVSGGFAPGTTNYLGGRSVSCAKNQRL